MEKIPTDQNYKKTVYNNNMIFYRVLYILIHTLWFVVVKVYSVLRFNYKALSYFLYKYSPYNSKPLQTMMRSRRTPNHLAIILGEEDASLQDLANIVIWSLFSGIPFVSFFDHKGRLKKKEDNFKEVVSNLVKEGEHVIWHDNFQNSSKNGFTGRKIHIKVLSLHNGKSAIVRAAEELIDTSVTVESVDNFLKKEFEFPDPDLAIYCGKKCTTWGYPPWQLRLTEFLNLESTIAITPNVFIELLYRYSKCEQRLGK